MGTRCPGPHFDVDEEVKWADAGPEPKLGSSLSLKVVAPRHSMRVQGKKNMSGAETA